MLLPKTDLRDSIFLQQWKNSRVFRDIVIIAAFILILLVSAFALDLYDVLNEFLHSNEHWEADEFIISFIFIALGLAVFAIRRWKDLKSEIDSRIKTEKAFQINEARLQSLIDTTSDWIWEVDENIAFTYVSPRIKDIIGYTAEDIIGKTPLDILEYKDAIQMSEYIRKTAQLKKSFKNLEHAYPHKDGSVIFLETSGVPILDEEGNLKGYRGINKDITERKRAEKELQTNEARLRSLFETTSDWIWEADTTGILNFVSPRIKDILGYEPEEIIGKNFSVYMDNDEAERIDKIFEKFTPLGKPLIAVENINLHKDGHEVYVETSAVPIFNENGKTVGYRGANRDISERRRSEEALRKAHDKLEERVRERTAELKVLNKKLMRKVEELDEFTYIASHDLHEPLRKITAFSDLLRQDIGTDLPPDARTDLNYILDAGKRMQMLIDHLLILSRTGRKAINREMISLADCAKDAIEALEIKISEKNVKIESDDLPVVYGDKTVLTQLYQNLIGNAIKFNTDLLPVVKLTAENVEGRLILGVWDNGIGIKPEFAQKIFAPFQRLHGRDQFEGTGIGLAICRKAVERHGGEIWVESEPRKGAHFRFTIGEKTKNNTKENTCHSQEEGQPSSCSPKMTPATAS